MNIPTSEYNYSSGCESGWTVYFDQLSNSVDHQYQQNRDFVTKSCEDQENNEEEDEDLSMVSDASSGPPHYNGFQYDHDQNNYFAAAAAGGGSGVGAADGGVYSQYYGGGGGGGGGAADGGVYSQYYGGGGGGGGAAEGGVYSQYYGYHAPPSDIKKSGKNASKKKTQCLDDTASSPDFDFSRDNVLSHAISSEHVEGEYSMTKKKFGFFKSSGKGKSSSFLGRKRQ